MQGSTQTERLQGPRRDECVHALFAAAHAYRLVREVLAGKTPDSENLIGLIVSLDKLDDAVFSLTSETAEDDSFSARADDLQAYWPQNKGQSIEIEVYAPPAAAAAPPPEPPPMRSML